MSSHISDSSQENVIEAACDPNKATVLVTAPPGSGKTYTGVRIAKALIEKERFDNEQRVLFLTFSKNARIQLENEAKKQLSGEQRKYLELSNYHAFFFENISYFSQYLGLPFELEVVSETERLGSLEGFILDEELFELPSHRKKRGLLSCASSSLELLNSDYRYEGLPLQVIDEVKIFADFILAKNRSGEIYFDDFAYYFLRLLQESSWLKEIYQYRYPTVIVDEFQDSSAIQWDIVNIIADRNQLILFADNCQLVYEWRGASRERLDEVKRFRQPTDLFELKGQHRYANKHSLGQFFKNLRLVLFEDADIDLSRPKSVHVDPYKYPGKVKFRLKGYISSKLRRKDQKLNTIGVIARWPWEIEDQMQYLQKEGFYPRLISENSTQHVINRKLLRVLSAIYSGEPFLCDLMEMFSFFPSHEMIDWDLLDSCFCRGIFNLKCLKDQVSSRQMTYKLAEELNQFSNCPIDDVASLKSVLNDGFPTLHERIELDDLHHELNALEVAIIRHHSKTSNISAKSDLDICRGDIARRSIAKGQEVKPGINMLTVLQAKGKEFDHVILTNCRDDCFPDDWDGRNMFYVALTRAKKSVTIFKPIKDACKILKLIQ